MKQLQILKKGFLDAIPLTFLSLIISELKKLDHLIVIMTSGIISLIAYNFSFKIYIIISVLIALCVAYILIAKFKNIPQWSGFGFQLQVWVLFFTRYSMLAFVNPKLLSKTTRKILTYVPSAVFPAIIFPAVFLDKKGFFVSIENPQIWAFVVAVVAGYYFNHLHRLN